MLFTIHNVVNNLAMCLKSHAQDCSKLLLNSNHNHCNPDGQGCLSMPTNGCLRHVIVAWVYEHPMLLNVKTRPKYQLHFLPVSPASVFLSNPHPSLQWAIFTGCSSPWSQLGLMPAEDWGRCLPRAGMLYLVLFQCSFYNWSFLIS